MYERDGSPRPSWLDPLAFAGLDQVPPPPDEVGVLEAELARLEARQSELDALIPDQTTELRELGVRLQSMLGSPHLAAEAERLGAEVVEQASKLTALRKERSENEAVLEGLRRRIERLRGREADDPRAHIRHSAEPVSVKTMRFMRATEIWAAVSISALLVGLAVLMLYSPSNVWAELIVLLVAFVIVEAVLRGTFVRTINSVAVILALIALVVLLVTYWTWAVAALLIGLASFLLYQRLREFRA